MYLINLDILCNVYMLHYVSVRRAIGVPPYFFCLGPARLKWYLVADLPVSLLKRANLFLPILIADITGSRHIFSYIQSQLYILLVIRICVSIPPCSWQDRALTNAIVIERYPHAKQNPRHRDYRLFGGRKNHHDPAFIAKCQWQTHCSDHQ